MSKELTSAESMGSIVKRDESSMDWATPKQVLEQVNLIQEIMKLVMKEGEHYGVIPGFKSKKPSLLKPGAEKLILTFKLVPVLEMEEKDVWHPTIKGHKEYVSNVKLYTRSGLYLGCGIGSCSTMENKYRFQKAEVEITDLPVPNQYWGLRGKNPEGALNLLGGKGFLPHKLDDGRWVIAIVQKDKVENTSPADDYNTCRKISKKRGLIDAVLTVTGASDIFTQDIEDIAENLTKQTIVKDAPVTPAPTQKNTLIEDKEIPISMEQEYGDVELLSPPDDKVWITDLQNKLINKLCDEGRMSVVDFRAYIEKQYALLSTKDLTTEQASAVIKYLLSLKPKKDEEKK
ncbi:MAG: hypothetical protein DDT40_01647 [candidate division WS2 bacterium]|nr:hypothetical protein [Candidatus Psychracetigena formicireducens]